MKHAFILNYLPLSWLNSIPTLSLSLSLSPSLSLSLSLLILKMATDLSANFKRFGNKVN